MIFMLSTPVEGHIQEMEVNFEHLEHKILTGKCRIIVLKLYKNKKVWKS
jgi:hypothetical protein